jgi:hypothetical protein
MPCPSVPSPVPYGRLVWKEHEWSKGVKKGECPCDCGKLIWDTLTGEISDA